MLTSFKKVPSRATLLTFTLAAASLFALPTPAYAGPCETGDGFGCGAEGVNPGTPGDPGVPGNTGNGNGQNEGGNNGPGNGPGLDAGDGNLGGEVGDAGEPALPDTEDTIAKAFNKIEFPVPTIETAPDPKTFVRVKTSFWIPEEEAEDLVVQASVGEAEGVQPQTITATAELKYVLWDLVEDEMLCEGAGRPNGEGPGEECDYYFKTSSAYHDMEAFEVKATPYWSITWTCEGVCPDGEAGVVDDEYPSPAGEIELVVDEIQTEAKDN
ncbi:hypothetical protein [Actinocorallia libanotica]|uniref:Collagen triple helix repeat protein n=1 Tax=Actinocorallia libanotica TaxID=46162 RepID=A0ABP4BMX9_9ACTN